MKLTPEGRAKVVRLRALLAQRPPRVRPAAAKENKVNQDAIDNSAKRDRESRSTSRWGMLGTALFAIAGIAVTLIGLALTHADSCLRMVKGGQQTEFRNFKSEGTSLTFLCVLHYAFTNSGLRADYVDRIEIHPVNLADNTHSEAKFVDRTRIKWRQTKELRFEVVLTTNTLTYDWRNFLVSFYDSEGRQIDQTSLTTRFLRPGDIIPKTRHMRTLTDGVSDVAPPPSQSLPTLATASLSATLPREYQDGDRRLFAKIMTTSGRIVALTQPHGELQKEGRFDATLNVVAKIDKAEPLGYMIYITPPGDPSKQLPSGFEISVKWTRTWSDGTSDVHATQFFPRSRDADPGPPEPP
jgi:hypothetical protein